MRLTVFVTGYCHLCDDMEAELTRLQREFDFAFDLVDIDTSDELDARYGERVPVLVGPDGEICAGRLDSRRLRALLTSPG